MTTLLIVLIILCVLLSSAIILLMINDKNTKKINFFIIFLTFLNYIPFYLLISLIGEIYQFESSYKFLILGLPVFLQGVWRYPVSMMIRKLKSRTSGFLIVHSIFLFFVLIVSFVKNIDAKVWLLAIAISFPGSSFGFTSQWHLENYNLSKVFKVLSIHTAIPFFAHLLSIIINKQIPKDLPDYESILNVTIWSLSGISVLIIVLNLIFKEDKTKFHLDEKIPNNFFYKYKFKNGLILIIELFIFMLLSALMTSKYIIEISSDNLFLYKLVFLSVAYIFVLLTHKYILKYLNIKTVKKVIILLLIFNNIISLVLINLNYNSSFLSYSILFINILLSTFYSFVLMGVAQHADHKNPELIFALFLSFSSAFQGLGIFIINSMELWNIKSATTLSNIVAISALVISISYILFEQVVCNINNKIYATPIEYEFNIIIK